MTAGTSNIPEWWSDAPDYAARPHLLQLMFQICLCGRCNMWTTVTPTTTSNLAWKSWKECSVQLNKIWGLALVGMVLIYGFIYPLINQPPSSLYLDEGCTSGLSVLPWHGVLSEHFIWTEVWMHLCSCCLVEETSGSLEANAQFFWLMGPILCDKH